MAWACTSVVLGYDGSVTDDYDGSVVADHNGSVVTAAPRVGDKQRAEGDENWARMIICARAGLYVHVCSAAAH